MTADIFDKTRAALARFREDITMPGGWSWNHKKTVERIDMYLMGRFEQGQDDDQGRPKYFYNVVKPACDTATKFIDLDTKDVMLLPDEGHETEVFFMRRDLRDWMRDKKFGTFLNAVALDFPRYGHVVEKRGKDKSAAKVNIENLRVDPAAPTLAESPFVMEVHAFSWRALSQMGWDKKAVKELRERMPEASVVHVYECYYQNEDADGKAWKRVILADLFTFKEGRGNKTVFHRSSEENLSMAQEYLPGVVLHEDEVDKLPYRELVWEKVPGRWMGIGFVEYLFDDQVRQNEIVNTEARAMLYTALHIFTTADEQIGRNLFTDLQDGDIIKSPTGINPVRTEERNLAAFQTASQRWREQTDRKTFSYDISRGDNMPSGTPLGTTRLLAGMVASYFELKRENFGIFVSEIIGEDALPDFLKTTAKEHTLRYAASDRDVLKLKRAIADGLLRRAILDFVETNNRLPSEQEVLSERARLLEKDLSKRDLFVKMPAGYYQGVTKPKVEVVVTGEQVDVQSRTQTLQTALTIIGSNPELLKDKVARATFFKMLELQGISPTELELLEEKIEEAPPPLPQVPEGMRQMPQPSREQQPALAMPGGMTQGL